MEVVAAVARARRLRGMSVRLSTVILPVHRWNEGGRARWQRAEELGFHTAYTYDHLSWRTFRDGPWFGALPPSPPRRRPPIGCGWGRS
ncbi:hypothetical protein SCALM49S_02690 [Streptomyces californicus]